MRKEKRFVKTTKQNKSQGSLSNSFLLDKSLVLPKDEILAYQSEAFHESDRTTEFSKASHGSLRPHNDRGNPFQVASYTYSRMQAPLQWQYRVWRKSQCELIDSPYFQREPRS